MQKNDRNDIDRLTIRDLCGKHLFPLENIDILAGGARDVLGHLRKLGMVKMRKVGGRKIPVLADIFKGRRCGRLAWVAAREDFEKTDRDLIEGRPAFCLTLEAARELVKLYERACGTAGSDGGQAVDGSAEHLDKQGDVE